MMIPDVSPILKYCLSSETMLNLSWQACLMSGSAALMTGPTAVPIAPSSVVSNWQFPDFKQPGEVKNGASLTSFTLIVRVV